MDHEKAVVVKTFLNLSEADLAAAELRSAGIECAISADDAGGVYPSLSLIKLLVDPARCNEARQILNDLPVDESSQPSTHPVAPSPLLPAAPPPPFAKFGWGMLVGAGVGALLHWGYIKSEQFGQHTYQYDNDHDGVMEEEWLWRNGLTVELRRDNNADGRIDYRSFYEDGVHVRDEMDCNFDGRPDLWFAVGPRGTYTSSRFDSDFDGRVDAFTSFVHGQASQVDWRPNETNVTILRQVFEKGVLREELRDTNGNGRFDVSIRYDAFNTPISTNFLELLSTPPAFQ